MFANGGSSSLSLGMLVASVGATAQAASIAEIAAMMPIAGAQYHWSWMLAPPRYKRFITWMQAWMTWFAWISLLLAASTIMATELESVIVLNNPGWDVQRWQTTLLIWSYLVLCVLLNVFAFGIVPMLETFCGIMHIVLFFVFLLVLLVCSRGRYNSHDFVWTRSSAESDFASGWDNAFVQWNLGLLTSAWCFVGELVS